MRRDEEQLQRAVCDLLAIYEAKHLLAYCHVPSGGYRTPAEAGILKAMGVKRGIPDLLIWTPNAHSFGIELKGPKGRESDAQILFRSTLESLGHRVYVCWSLDEVEAALRLERVPAVGKIAGGHPAGSQRVLEAAE